MKPGEYQLPRCIVRVDGKDIRVATPSIRIKQSKTGSQQEPSKLAFTHIVDNLKPYVGEQIIYTAEIASTEEMVKANISDIYSLGLAVVQRSLAKMQLREEELNVQGVDRLLSALDKIEKWRRLEEVKQEVDADNLELSDSEKDIQQHIFFKKGEEEAS